MKTFICHMEQKDMIKYNITVRECMLLDYLIAFFASGFAFYRIVNNKKYFWISLNKILSDLPSIFKRKSDISKLLLSLKKKNLIDKFIAERQKLFIYIEESLYLYV